MGKTILITGASAGIGRSAALALGKQGYTVYGAARRVEKMQDMKGVIPLRMDVTNEEEIREGLEEIKRNHGGVDVLINNAGLGVYGSVEETTMEDARHQFDVNIFGMASLSQKVIPHMRDQKYGRIINISSAGGKIYLPLGAWYHASKHAMEGWSDSLRMEVEEFGIDVIVVEPGLIKTEFVDLMTDPLLERSGQGPYRKLANQMVAMTRGSIEKGMASGTDAVDKAILKAVNDKRPRTRYVCGFGAGFILGARKWLSDRAFDKMMRAQLNRAYKSVSR